MQPARFSKILDMTESQFRERSLYLTEAQEQRETELFSKAHLLRSTH